MERVSQPGEKHFRADTRHPEEQERYPIRPQEQKDLSRQIRELTSAVERLAYQVHRMGENEVHEREKMALRLEVELLRFERRLPSGKPNDE